MKNLKWFLGLALALSFLTWSAPKVLAATDLKTNLETAIKQLQSALNLLASNDSLTTSSSDFGYYTPAWERGQVLGVAITGPCPNSGDAYKCPDGSYPTVTDNTMYCASGEATCQSSGTPPPSGSNNMYCAPCGANQHYEGGSSTSCGNCVNNTTSGSNNMYCAPCGSDQHYEGGSSTSCGTCVANNIQPMNQGSISGTFFCNSLKMMATKEQCDSADRTQGVNQTNPAVNQNNQPSCPHFDDCKNGRVVKKNINGAMCDVCEPSSQPNQQYQGYQPQQGQGQQGQPGQMMGPNQGQGDNQNWEEQQAKMDEQRLNDMRKNASRMGVEAGRINKEIARLAKKGVTISAGVVEAQKIVTGFVAEVKEATDADALSDSFTTFQDAMQTIQDAMPTLYQLANWPQIRKEANKRIAELNKMYTKYSKLKSKIDLSSYLPDIRTGIDAKQALFTQTDNDVKSGSADSLDNFPDDFFGDLQELYGQFQAMDIASNMAKNIKTFENGLKSDERAITAYAKKKGVDQGDVQELRGLLGAVKDQLAEIKRLMITKFDPDEMMMAMEDLMMAKGDLGEKLLELTGKGGTQFMPNIPQQNMMQFNIPQAFGGGQGPQTAPNNQGGEQQPSQQMATGTF